MSFAQDRRKNQRTLAIHVRTRSDGPYASRNLVKSETLRDISESTAFSRLPFIWLCPLAVQKPTLDSTSRGRFPKEFAINASSPHCASICFRLSTRGRRIQRYWKQTSVPHGLSAISSGCAPSRENGAGSIGRIAIPPGIGYDAMFRCLKTFLNADSLAS